MICSEITFENIGPGAVCSWKGKVPFLIWLWNGSTTARNQGLYWVGFVLKEQQVANSTPTKIRQGGWKADLTNVFLGATGRERRPVGYLSDRLIMKIICLSH